MGPSSEPLPSLSTVLGDSKSTRNQTEDSYLYNQYNVQSSLLTYPYPPQPVYYNPWQYPTLQPYDLYQPYPAMSPYDQQTLFQPSVIEINNNNNNSSFETSFERKPASVETVTESSPESVLEHSLMAPRIIQRRQRRLNRDISCSNCSTNDTSLWRKNDNGDLECNACNLYYRLNKVPRPKNLSKHPPRTRKRRSMKVKKTSEESDDE